MRYKPLGNSGPRVSEPCLGAITSGEDSGWAASKEERHRIPAVCDAAGGNFVDTTNRPKGRREVVPLDGNDTAEARILNGTI